MKKVFIAVGVVLGIVTVIGAAFYTFVTKLGRSEAILFEMSKDRMY